MNFVLWIFIPSIVTAESLHTAAFAAEIANIQTKFIAKIIETAWIAEQYFHRFEMAAYSLGSDIPNPNLVVYSSC